MLIVGELINTSRKAIKPLVEERDAAAIQDIAQKQVEAGAHYIDVNCGTMVFNEPETMAWLVETIQEKVSAPLCLDSPNPQALEAGLSLVKNGQPMINSITAEKERFAAILPLVTKYKAKSSPCVWMMRCRNRRGTTGHCQETGGLVRRRGAGDDIYLILCQTHQYQ